MLYEYKDFFVAAYALLLWPLIVVGFFISKDANTRWFLLGFALITALSVLSGKAIKVIGAPGWVFHLSNIGVAWLVIQFVVYRPQLSVFFGKKMQTLPIAFLRLIMAIWLPAQYSFRLVPAELAMRKLYMGMAVVHGVVVLSYMLAYAGVTSAGGLLEQHGINRRIVWDSAYSSYLAFLVLELLLLLTVIVSGFRMRFKA